MTRGSGVPSPSRAGTIPAFPPAALGRQEEGNQACVEGRTPGRGGKGLRNPLLWGAFKWGEIPTQFPFSRAPCPAFSRFPHRPSSLLLLHFLSVRLAKVRDSTLPPTCVPVSLPFSAPCSGPGSPGAPRLPGEGIRIHASLQGMASLAYTAQGHWLGKPTPTPPAASGISCPHLPGWHLWNLGTQK